MSQMFVSWQLESKLEVSRVDEKNGVVELYIEMVRWIFS